MKFCTLVAPNDNERDCSEVLICAYPAPEFHLGMNLQHLKKGEMGLSSVLQPHFGDEEMGAVLHKNTVECAHDQRSMIHKWDVLQQSALVRKPLDSP